MGEFQEGYNYIINNTAILPAIETQNPEYIESIREAIDVMVEHLNEFSDSQKTIDTLSGDLAEFWHSDTRNLDAISKLSDSRTEVPRTNAFASPDIVNPATGEEWQIKYRANAKISAKELAKTYEEASKRPKTRAGAETALRSGDVSPNDLVYRNMDRIVPSDQLDDVNEFYKRKEATESARRPDQVKRYKISREHTNDRIVDKEGFESKPLSRESSKELARKVKEDGISKEDLSEEGISAQEYAQKKILIQNICKAGLTSAVITAALKAAPELIKAFEYLFSTGKIDIEGFQKAGLNSIEGGAEGFIKGTITATVITALQSEAISLPFNELQPGIVGAIVVIAYDMIKDAILVAQKRITQDEMVRHLIKDVYISSVSVGLGIVGQIVLYEAPVLGYMIGSIVGSVIGTVTYFVGEKVFLALCVNTGFTLFGLVDQSYEISDETMKEIGLDVFQYDEFSYDEFTLDEMQIESFSYDEFVPLPPIIKPVKRGVIGVARVGYVNV